jgi:23S rRNA (uracil1939-C5)-methyltransferase
MEFYAGVGAIGLSLLERARQLCLNELGSGSLEGLALGLAGLTPAQRAMVEVVSGTAGAAAAHPALSGSDVVIADPPRKGLDLDLVQQLCERPPARLVYVSCDLASLAADTARLTEGGALRLCELRAFNLIPFTDHVETLARFERVDQPCA